MTYSLHGFTGRSKDSHGSSLKKTITSMLRA